MNGVERRYAALLDARLSAGEIVWWKYEGMSFRLAELKCHFHPDFSMMLADGTIEIHETKGAYIREDAWLKLKIAASMYPFVFRKCVWDKGQWTITEVGTLQKEPHVESSPSPRSRTPKKTERMALVNGKPVSYADALAMITKKSA